MPTTATAALAMAGDGDGHILHAVSYASSAGRDLVVGGKPVESA